MGVWMVKRWRVRLWEVKVVRGKVVGIGCVWMMGGVWLVLKGKQRSEMGEDSGQRIYVLGEV